MSILILACRECKKKIACVCTDTGDQGTCNLCRRQYDCPYKEAVTIEAKKKCRDCNQVYRVV